MEEYRNGLATSLNMNRGVAQLGSIDPDGLKDKDSKSGSFVFDQEKKRQMKQQ